MRAGADQGVKNVTYSISHLLNPHEDLPQRPVMCEKLDLARAIEKYIILLKYNISRSTLALPNFGILIAALSPFPQ